MIWEDLPTLIGRRARRENLRAKPKCEALSQAGFRCAHSATVVARDGRNVCRHHADPDHPARYIMRNTGVHIDGPGSKKP